MSVEVLLGTHGRCQALQGRTLRQEAFGGRRAARSCGEVVNAADRILLQGHLRAARGDQHESSGTAGSFGRRSHILNKSLHDILKVQAQERRAGEGLDLQQTPRREDLQALHRYLLSVEEGGSGGLIKECFTLVQVGHP